MLHPSERKLAIRPCGANDIHSIRWRVDPDKPLVAKTISCPHFGNALYQIMEWNPDYVYHIRGSWVARANDEIIVFNLSNAMPAAYFDAPSEDSDEVRRRRIEMCPDEWKDTFGEDFYDYTVENSHYFMSPRTDWKADSECVLAPGLQQMAVKTEFELAKSIEGLRNNGGSDE